MISSKQKRLANQHMVSEHPKTISVFETGYRGIHMGVTYFRISMRIVLAISVLFGCSEQGASMNTLDVATSIAELKSHIDPPLQPHQVQWQVIAHHIDETPLPGGRYSLVALLDYTPSEIEHLKQLSGVVNHGGRNQFRTRL